MFTSRAKRLLTLVAVLALFVGTQGSAQNNSSQQGTTDHEIVAFLNQAIQWYRQITGEQQFASDASDVLYLDSLHQQSLEVLRDCFAFARAVVALAPANASTDNAQPGPTDQPATVNAHNLANLAAKAQNDLKQRQEELDGLEKELASATGKKLQTLRAQVAETRSEVDLAQARSETLNNFVQFINSTASGNRSGVNAQIDDLERTVPELRAQRVVPVSQKPGASAAKESDAAASTAAASTVQHKQQPAGMIGMIEEGLGYNSKLAAQKDALASTAALREAIQKIRAPLMQELRSTSQQGQQLSAAPDLTDANAVDQRTKQIEALTARFKQDSAAVTPIGKALIVLDSVRGTLTEWRNDTSAAYRQELKRLMLRLFVLLMAVLAVFVASEIWRKATLRYVQDIRRRNQFMLLRRIVVTFAIVLIVLFMLVTEVGSIATFAGFITAGLAVALQTVILSVVAYFLLIGKWGIRVGDRVSISGVTGDVIDIGLVRMQLMEVDTNAAEEQPTGRVVIFSNAVLFQPAANFFKQIPGTSFTWHRVTLTLAPDTDYRRAEKLILDAVSQVFAEYREEIKRQHNRMQEMLTIPVKTPAPQSRFRFTDAGLELVVRYPVPLESVSLMDDRVTRALVQALREEPRLRLVQQGTPAIQPVAETPNMDKHA